jgi:hypothetical protein
MEMQSKNNQQMREQWIHSYVQALDRGDAGGIEAALNAALSDPELSEAIDEVNLHYLEEAGISAFSMAAQTVANLAQKHLAGAAEQQERMASAPTVGEVAAQLQAQRLVYPEDEAINRCLIRSQRPIPLELTVRNLTALFAELGLEAGKRYVRAFKDAAIWLDISRSQSQLKLAAREANHRKR